MLHEIGLAGAIGSTEILLRHLKQRYREAIAAASTIIKLGDV